LFPAAPAAIALDLLIYGAQGHAVETLTLGFSSNLFDHGDRPGKILQIFLDTQNLLAFAVSWMSQELAPSQEFTFFRRR
jgi:hypothetical protein